MTWYDVSMFKYLFTAVCCLGILRSEIEDMKLDFNEKNQESIKEIIKKFTRDTGEQTKFCNMIESIIDCQKQCQIPGWNIQYKRKYFEGSAYEQVSGLTLWKGEKPVEIEDKSKFYAEGSIYFKSTLFSLIMSQIEQFYFDKIHLIGFKMWTKDIRGEKSHIYGGLGFYECAKLCLASNMAKEKGYKYCLTQVTFKKIERVFNQGRGASYHDFLTQDTFPRYFFLDENKTWDYETKEEMEKKVRKLLNKIGINDIEKVIIDSEGDVFHKETKYNMAVPELGIKERQEITIPEAKYARILVKRSSDKTPIDVTDGFYKQETSLLL